MMINIKKKIIILLIITAVLAMTAIIVPNIDIKGEETTQDEPITYQVSDFTISAVTEIEIGNENGVLRLKKDGDKWIAIGYEDVELNQDIVSDIVYIFTHITTQKLISTDTLNKDIYGLDKPTAVIKTYHEAGWIQEYMIGDKAPIVGEYYMSSRETDMIFTVNSSVSAYSKTTIDDIKSLNSISIPIEELMEFSIDNKKTGENYTIKKISANNDISLCYWEFADGFSHDVDTRVLYLGSEGYDYNLIDTLCAVSGKEVLSSGDEFFADTAKDDYLLSANLYSSAGYEEKFTLYDYDDSNYALAFSGDEWIYSIPHSYITFMDIDIFMLCDPNLALISINSVNNVNINLPEVKTNIEVSPYIKKNADGTNMVDAYGNEVVAVDILMDEVDSLPLDNISKQEQMTWFYQDLVTIKIDDVVDIEDIVELNKIGSINYKFSSDYMSEYNIEFYEYSLTHYIAVTNGFSAFLVNKREILKINNAYEKLIAGKLDISY